MNTTKNTIANTIANDRCFSRIVVMYPNSECVQCRAVRGSWVNIQSRGLEEVTLLAALGGNNSDSFCDSDLQSKDMLQMFFFIHPCLCQEQNHWKQIQYQCNSRNDHLNHLHCKDESNTPYLQFQGNKFQNTGVNMITQFLDQNLNFCTALI